ncbi:DUF1971 domain-containing protein [Shewanella nanhaiensis]|uniref:DUF1971 domain-containing protein n=1 Tax=Shewanella nanhaiensis TaxID=2864872 RepID=A0ABS7E195_9GAMM|nr:DUF1971 domain-containing protein [Shewanella nanhaiensis]MBW8183435.1 DUF1971 domain-containing protein [Shewanella nanhaiensis]
MSFTPKGYTHCESTQVYTNENVPKILLEPHYTKMGVYEQIHVLCGVLKYLGCNSHTQITDKEVVIKANETAMAHPNYLHRLEPASDDLKFEIRFYSLEARSNSDK